MSAVRLTAASMIVAFALSASSGASVKVPFFGASPTVDGRLDDKCWETAPRLPGASLGDKASVLVVQDPENLCLAVRGQPGKNIAVLLRPGGEWTYALDLSPDRPWHSARFVGSGKSFHPEDWEAGKVAVLRGSGEWTAEIRLPFASLDFGQADTLWQVSVQSVHADLDPCGLEDILKFAAWTEIVLSSFDRKQYPWRFERIDWGELLPGKNELTVFVVGDSARLYRATLVLRVRDASGQPVETVRERFTIPEQEPSMVTIPYRLPLSEAERLLIVEVWDTETQQCRLTRNRTARPQALLEAAVKDGEEVRAGQPITVQGKLNVATASAETAALSMVLQAEPGGEVAAQKLKVRVRGRSFQTEFATQGLTPGMYSVVVRAVVADLNASPSLRLRVKVT